MTSDDKPRTVFGAPDQDEIISRLDTVADDDETSTFFSGSNELAGQAQRRFAEGVSTFGGVPVGEDALSGDAPATREGESAFAAGAPAGERVASGTLPLTDPADRSAFILGGPAALGH